LADRLQQLICLGRQWFTISSIRTGLQEHQSLLINAATIETAIAMVLFSSFRATAQKNNLWQ
jgi:hypothetical protein